MSIKVKSGGAYADIVGAFVKQGGVYGAASVFAKVAGAYQAVGGGSTPLDFIGYGQSNWVFHTTVTVGGTPPAAHPDTFIWDPNTSQWVAPAGTGVRTFLNSMQAATGRVCRLVSGGTSGANIADLQKGGALYTQLMGRVTASGANPSFILWHHGEGDANTPAPSGSSYRTSLNQIHTDIASDTGKTVSQIPLVCSSLATVTVLTEPDSSWATIQDALAGINSVFPNIHYSHSNMDAVLTDGIHWDGPSYGRSGARYAQTVQFLQGTQSTRPLFFASTTAERLSVTTTRIDVVHNMGSDFTPTSGITGFEVSGDNGVNWVSATGARLDADSITLTHADLGTAERLIRYQYGKAPNVTAPVKDNGSIQAPLNFNNGSIVAAGAVALPSITYAATADSTVSTSPQLVSGISVPGASKSLLALIGHTINTGVNAVSCSVTCLPSNTVVSATLVTATPLGANAGTSIFQAALPSGTTSINVSVTMDSNPFSRGRVHVSTVPVSRLNSTTSTGSASLRTTTSATSTVNIATSDGGVVFAVGQNSGFGNTGSTVIGTETYITRASSSFDGGHHMVADTSGTSANAASVVTANFIATTNSSSVSAASWR